jgi:asparagine synthase (glutamine-hydrolysing)
MKNLITNALHDIAAHPSWDRHHACVILSGGVDSSIAATAGRPILGLTAAFTVLCSPGCSDRQYAAEVASTAQLQHHIADVRLDEILHELPFCIRVLQTFDPMTLRNSISVCRALGDAVAAGFSCAVTGDGADELFGGYDYIHAFVR